MPPPELPQIVTIVGPTASGKTLLSLILARELQSEIVSADSRQFYRHLAIGTAKPNRDELTKIRHHFIDFLEPDEMYSAGEYGKSARLTLRALVQQGKVPVVVGGSGLYVRALIDGFYDGPGRNDEIREQLERRWNEGGGAAMYEELRRFDPETAMRMDKTKKRRVMRALEVYYITGTPLSQLHRLQESEPEFDFCQVALDWPRSILYHRINARVDHMMQLGLLEEVKNLLPRGFGAHLNALNTVGYRELLNFIEGKIASLDEATDLIKRNTRRFAKRQLTWFRADKRIRWIRVMSNTPMEEIAEGVLAMLKSGK